MWQKPLFEHWQQRLDQGTEAMLTFKTTKSFEEINDACLFLKMEISCIYQGVFHVYEGNFYIKSNFQTRALFRRGAFKHLVFWRDGGVAHRHVFDNAHRCQDHNTFIFIGINLLQNNCLNGETLGRDMRVFWHKLPPVIGPPSHTARKLKWSSPS